MVEDIDISICPISMTKNSPIAIIAVNAVCRRMFIRLSDVLNVLRVMLNMTTRAMRRKSIIQSLINDRQLFP